MEQARPALARLEQNIGRFSEAQQNTLLIGLANAHEHLGDREKTRRLLGQVAERQPLQLGIRQRLFFLALAAGDDAAAQTLQAEMRKIEGEEGVLWRHAEATRLVTLATKGDKTGLVQARQLLAKVAKSRHAWPRVPLLRARIDELEGNVDSAVENYQRALELGEQSFGTVQRLVQLLTARRRVDEAERILDQLQARAAIPADLARLATQVSLLNHDTGEHTLELADKAAAKDSKDYRDQVFRAQVLWSVGKSKEAEAAFRQAVALGPKAPETWVALVTFLAETDQKQQAVTETGKARQALPADKAPLALAACYQAGGQGDKAEEQYAALLQGKPNDLTVLGAAARFFLGAGEFKKAEPLLRQIIASPASAGDEGPRWARRGLALTLASGSDFSQSRQALALIDENLRERPESPEDQRVRALVLALQPGGRRQSIKTLESAYARQRPTPEEQLLLAQLYEANHDWTQANEYLVTLLNSKGGATPPHLAYYVRALLRQDKVTEAAGWLERLKNKAPGTAATVEMTARFLAKKGKQGWEEEASRLIRDYVNQESTAKKEPSILAAGAGLLEELNQETAAESLYRKYVSEISAKKPESVLVLALFLARHKRLSEGLDLCEGAWQKCKPELMASACEQALHFGQPKTQDYQRVQRWLEASIKQNPEVQILPLALANVLVTQGRRADAEAIYRSILARNPKSLVALNNLAWQLARDNSKQTECLELINRAMEIGGPAADLLDTRGMCNLLMGQTNQAVKDLEDAVAERPKALYYFHLAQAYLQADKQPAAEKAWVKAREMKFGEMDVPRLEIEEYRKLAAEFDQ